MPFTPVSTNNSDETNWNNINNGFRDVFLRETVEIFKDDTGTPVVILDKNGLKTTTPGGGISVLDATDSEYTFDSNRQTLRIVDQGTISCTAPTVQRTGSTGGAVNSGQTLGSASFTFDVSESYTVLGYVEITPGAFVLMPYTTYANNSGTNITSFTYGISVTGGLVQVNGDAGTYGSGLNLQTGAAYTVRYFVLLQSS